MNVAFIITYCDCHISHFADVKMRVILVIIRCDPAHPHPTGFLARKHSDRIIVLVMEEGGMTVNISSFRRRWFNMLKMIFFFVIKATLFILHVDFCMRT